MENTEKLERLFQEKSSILRDHFSLVSVLDHALALFEEYLNDKKIHVQIIGNFDIALGVK